MHYYGYHIINLIKVPLGAMVAHRMDDWGLIPYIVWDFISSPLHPDQLWGTSSLLLRGYQGLSGQVMKLTFHLHLVSRLWMCWAIPPLPNMSSWCGS